MPPPPLVTMIFSMDRPLFPWFGLLATLCLPAVGLASPPPTGGGSFLFIHPDGSGLTAWNALRIMDHGPDGTTAWDQLPALGLYRGHLVDSLSATSNAGGTIHAYGVKVSAPAYGQDGPAPLISASGFAGSLLHEAIAGGLPVGIVNSGHLAEPGTGVYLASVEKRSSEAEIVRQILSSGADVIFGGGEVLFLPVGVVGHHGSEGVRTDGLNLVEHATASGYTVIYEREELLTLPDHTDKVLGLFAARDTYNSKTEAELAELDLPMYWADAPTVAEMTSVALRVLGRDGRQFALVVEEEGTDNFGNANSAAGWLEALRRADASIAVGRAWVAANPSTLLLVAADSEAGSPDIYAVGRTPVGSSDPGEALPERTHNGGALDGATGTATPPFVSAPDQFGRRHRFGISWGARDDNFGGVVVRAEGYTADRLPLHVDNTTIFALGHAVLFPAAAVVKQD